MSEEPSWVVRCLRLITSWPFRTPDYSMGIDITKVIGLRECAMSAANFQTAMDELLLLYALGPSHHTSEGRWPDK
jgi:hypothetical protein